MTELRKAKMESGPMKVNGRRAFVLRKLPIFQGRKRESRVEKHNIEKVKIHGISSGESTLRGSGERRNTVADFFCSNFGPLVFSVHLSSFYAAVTVYSQKSKRLC